MMQEGQFDAVIVSNDIRAAGTGSEFVYLLLAVGEEQIAAQIWLTKKAANMARVQLRACGFDTATEALSILRENREHLRDKKVKIEVQEETYKDQTTLKARILTATVSKKRIGELDTMLKAKDEPGEEEDDIPF